MSGKLLNQETIYTSHVLVQGFDCVLFLFFPDMVLDTRNDAAILFLMRSIGICLIGLTWFIHCNKALPIHEPQGRRLATGFAVFHGLSTLLILDDIIRSHVFPYRYLGFLFHGSLAVLTYINTC
ncbi:hypothetical protein BC940DRAFT_301183 [Gongronella butleri]|nr:hypothetical protein BC940DRAFT_301183 [Gongronella butleri]